MKGVATVLSLVGDSGHSSSGRERSAAARYGVATLAVVVALLIKAFISPLVGGSFLLLSVAVLVGAVFGGFGPAVVATLLGGLVGDYFFIAPVGTLIPPTADHATMTVLFLVQGLAISFIGDRLAAARRRSEEDRRSLSYSESRLAEAQRIARIGNWRYDAGSGEAYFSEELYRIFGLEPREPAPGYRTILKLVHPDDRRAVREALREAAGGARAGLEFRIVRPDGEERAVFVGCEPVVESSGRVSGLFGTVQDVTERRRAEDALRDSEERYRVVAETASDAIVVIGEDGRIYFVNEAAGRTFGYGREQMLGEPLTMLMPERLRQAHRDALQRYLRTGQRRLDWRSAELPGLHSSGREISLELSFGEFAQDGRRYFTGFIRDVSERKKIEEALQISEERFRSVIEQSPLSVQILSTDGGTLRVNRAWEELWGATLGQINAAGYNVLEDEQLVEKGVMPYIEKGFAGEPAVVPPIVYDPDESIPELAAHESSQRWVSSFIYPVKDEAENIREVTLIHVDITERVRAEEELRRSEERYRTLFESMEQGFCVIEALFDEEGEPEDYRFVEVNPAFEHQTGLGEAVGGTARELVPSLEEHWVRVYGEVALTGEPASFESGSEAMGRWFEVYAFRVGGEESRRVAVLFSDITERKRAEERLSQSESLYRAVVEQAAENIFLVDVEDGRILESNASLYGALGYTQEELARMTLYDIVAADRESVDLNVRSVQQAGSYYVGERRYRRKDGTELSVEVGASLIYREGRETICVVAHDIEDRKQREEAMREVRQAERARIALELHDGALQDIIYALQEAQILEEISGGEHALGEVAESLRRSVEGIRAAIFELRLEETLRESFIVGVRDTVDLHRRMARKSYGIKLEVAEEFPKDPSWEAGQGIIRILQEALSNARRHSAAGAVVVSLRAGGEDALVEVSDDGRGFDPKTSGGGMGTNSMRQRARELGGEVSVRSVPGAGTRVRLRIPISRLRERRASEQSSG